MKGSVGSCYRVYILPLPLACKLWPGEFSIHSLSKLCQPRYEGTHGYVEQSTTIYSTFAVVPISATFGCSYSTSEEKREKMRASIKLLL